MAQISTKRKNSLIVSVIITVLVASSIGTVILINLSPPQNQKDNVKVSGTVVSTGILTLFESSLQTIEFTDIQTGTKTTYFFSFPPHSYNPIGNYSVTLKNGHTYNVTVSYSYTIGSMNPSSDNVGTFTVYAPEGETSIIKNFS